MVRWDFLEDYETVVQMYTENLSNKAIEDAFEVLNGHGKIRWDFLEVFETVVQINQDN